MPVSMLWCRARAVLSGIALLGICCRPGPDAFIVALRVDGDVVGSESHGTTRLVEMLAAVDVDRDGDDELLASSYQGLVIVDGGRRRHTLWEGDAIRQVEQMAGTEPPRFDLLVLVGLDYEPTLIHLSCSFGDAPRCEQAGELALDPSAFEFVSADFDEDGRTDVVVLDVEALRLYRGAGGAPNQIAWSDGVVIDGGPTWLSSPYGAATADIDGDEHGDIVVTQLDGVDVLFGTGAGTFDEPTQLPVPEKIEPEGVRIAMIVGDDLPDILATGFEGGVVYENRGNRELVASWSFAPPQFDMSTAFLGSFDDAPGQDILLVDEGFAPSARIASFSTATSSWTVRALGSVQSNAYFYLGVVADLDGDGRDEVLSIVGAPIYCE